MSLSAVGRVSAFRVWREVIRLGDTLKRMEGGVMPVAIVLTNKPPALSCTKARLYVTSQEL